MTVIRPWIAGTMCCKVCGNVGVYNASEQKCPKDWIYLNVFGVDGFVCSQFCIVQARVEFEKQKKALEESRKLGPLLPPEVVL